MTNYHDGGQLRFTLSQLLQVITLLLAGMIGWASLRSEVREMRMVTEYRLSTVEARLSGVETRLSRIEARRR